LKHQLRFDSRIILYILSPEFKLTPIVYNDERYNAYYRECSHHLFKIQQIKFNKFMKSIFPEHDFCFCYACAYTFLDVNFGENDYRDTRNIIIIEPYTRFVLISLLKN
jgi:hypothetical protein